MAKRYSAAERKAFHMGRAYETGKQGGRVKCPDEKTKQSFRNGVNAVKGKKSVQTKNNKSGSPLYLVNSDGVILKTYGGGKAK